MIGTEGIMFSWENVKTKTNRVGLSGIETIVGLGIGGNEYNFFSWYDVGAKNKAVVAWL